MKPRFYTLWAINAALDERELYRQLDRLRGFGFDGAVFHPRFYPNEPPYLSDEYLAILSRVILHAKSIGMDFWIYDENGWPSGTVGGALLKHHPGDVQQWADLVTEPPADCLGNFERDGQRWFVARRRGVGVDYFNPNLARHFIEMTHERYRQGLSPAAFEHVSAFFCDEPEFGLGHTYDALSPHGAMPWTPRLPELFRARYGEELEPLLPKLFFPGDGCGEARVKFWELLTDVFNESFNAPLNEWCRRHGKRYTAHVKGEEHPLFQVPTSGSCHQVFQHLALPAIDALERYLSNHFYPRQISSAARQFGDGRCMVEAFGGAGWGARPEDLERYLLWLGRHGLTDFVLHLSQYRLDSAAIRDWPPSQPLHLTWREVYPEVLNRFRRELEKNPRPPADTLVIAPYRGIMGSYEPWELLKTNVHNARTYPATAAGKINRRFMELIETLHRAGVSYDLADERTLEQSGKLANGQLTLGKCVYRRVIVDGGCQLNAATRLLVQPVTVEAEAIVVESKPIEVASVTQSAAAHEAKFPVQWTLAKHPINSLLLECAPDGEGWFTAKFLCPAPLPDGALDIVFADDIAELVLNGTSLLLASSNEGSRAKPTSSEVRLTNTLRFRPTRRVERPFVWLRGVFRVKSGSVFADGPRETVKTDGPFTIHPADESAGRDLVAEGFPFLRDPLVALATFELLREAASLRLDGVEADAVRLTVDGRDCGWTWRTNGEFRFAAKLSAGAHRIRIELVPNTYNTFGPHHYYGGDWFVISPDQFTGRRNFADPHDAPPMTHVKAWHFRRFQLPEHISVSG
jgi:hypothetical protein